MQNKNGRTITFRVDDKVAEELDKVRVIEHFQGSS